MINHDLLRAEIAQHPYKLLFATISGAHLYGFPSPDSDYDLRGVHILPIHESVGLLPKRETVQVEGLRSGIEIDFSNSRPTQILHYVAQAEWVRNGAALFTADCADKRSA